MSQLSYDPSEMGIVSELLEQARAMFGKIGQGIGVIAVPDWAGEDDYAAAFDGVWRPGIAAASQAAGMAESNMGSTVVLNGETGAVYAGVNEANAGLIR